MARTGRPREFDRGQALEGAMHLFWENGYEGTSLDALRRAMGGLSSASFYAAFGSKARLYREALRRYLDTHGQVVAVLGDRSVPPRERIERMLRQSAQMQTGDDHPKGCMVTLSATICSPDGAFVQALTLEERAANRRLLDECVADAVEAGALEPAAAEGGLATMFDAVLNGMAMQARDGVRPEAIELAIGAALMAWDGYATPRAY